MLQFTWSVSLLYLFVRLFGSTGEPWNPFSVIEGKTLESKTRPLQGNTNTTPQRQTIFASSFRRWASLGWSIGCYPLTDAHASARAVWRISCCSNESCVYVHRKWKPATSTGLRSNFTVWYNLPKEAVERQLSIPHSRLRVRKLEFGKRETGKWKNEIRSRLISSR